MHLEENIEAREQKPHRWSIVDPSESNDHYHDGNDDDDGCSGGCKYGNHPEKESNVNKIGQTLTVQYCSKTFQEA